MWNAVKNMALRIQGKRIVGVDFSNGFKQTFVEQQGGAALFGRTRRMILERDTDMYSTEDVHPLWHAWLNHRLEQPPTPEEVEAYRRHQQKVSQNVAAMLESQKQAQHVLIQSQAPVAEPEEEKLTLTPARSGRSVTIPSSTPSSESDTLPRGSAAAVKLRSDRETDSSSLHSPWRSEDREQSTVSGQLTDTASSPADLSRPPADGLGVSLNSVLQSDEFKHLNRGGPNASYSQNSNEKQL